MADHHPDAARFVEAFHPAFDAITAAVRAAARRLAGTDWAPFANALREIEAAETKNGTKEAADE